MSARSSSPQPQRRYDYRRGRCGESSVTSRGGGRLWLQKGAKDNLNLRSAILHARDAVSAFGVVLAGVLAAHRNPLAMPVVSGSSPVLNSLRRYDGSARAPPLCSASRVTPAGPGLPAVIGAIKSVGRRARLAHRTVWMSDPAVVACSSTLV